MQRECHREANAVKKKYMGVYNLRLSILQRKPTDIGCKFRRYEGGKVAQEKYNVSSKA